MSKLDDLKRLGQQRLARAESREKVAPAASGRVDRKSRVRAAAGAPVDVLKAATSKPRKFKEPEAAPAKRKVGRPKGGLSQSKPWEAEGISRRTWYRNKGKS